MGLVFTSRMPGESYSRQVRSLCLCCCVCVGGAAFSGTQNDMILSWITLWGMIKVYWLDDLTLAYIWDHAVCSASAASSGRSLHPIISHLRTKYSSSNCPYHVRRTMSSIKKRSKVRRILRAMFGEANVHPVKNGFNGQFFDGAQMAVSL